MIIPPICSLCFTGELSMRIREVSVFRRSVFPFSRKPFVRVQCSRFTGRCSARTAIDDTFNNREHVLHVNISNNFYISETIGTFDEMEASLNRAMRNEDKVRIRRKAFAILRAFLRLFMHAEHVTF